MSHRLDEAILLRLERNDPDVDSLLVDGSYWTDRAGSVIGDSKMLTKISFRMHVEDEEPADERWRWLDELFDGLARNRTSCTRGRGVLRPLLGGDVDWIPFISLLPSSSSTTTSSLLLFATWIFRRFHTNLDLLFRNARIAG